MAPYRLPIVSTELPIPHGIPAQARKLRYSIASQVNDSRGSLADPARGPASDYGRGGLGESSMAREISTN